MQNVYEFCKYQYRNIFNHLNNLSKHLNDREHDQRN